LSSLLLLSSIHSLEVTSKIERGPPLLVFILFVLFCRVFFFWIGPLLVLPGNFFSSVSLCAWHPSFQSPHPIIPALTGLGSNMTEAKKRYSIYFPFFWPLIARPPCDSSKNPPPDIAPLKEWSAYCLEFHFIFDTIQSRNPPIPPPNLDHEWAPFKPIDSCPELFLCMGRSLSDASF